MLKRLTILASVAALAVCVGARRPQGTPYVPKTATDTIPGTAVSFELVQLPAGFVMLADVNGKQRLARVGPIWIGKTEVTWDEYDVFWMALDLPQAERQSHRSTPRVARSRPSVPYEPPYRGWGHSGWPAGSVSFESANQYCRWLSTKTGKKYRLPTEAEWEYACRAGGRTLRPDRTTLLEVAWLDLNSEEQTHPVGKKRPNAWGLYDTLGNVAEWVTTLDGKEADAGGSYQDADRDVHSGGRERYSRQWQRRDPQVPVSRSWLSDAFHVGFRVVRED
jgi:formylglycine-generating enzyme required for sulfatase activity